MPTVRQHAALEMTEFEWFHWWPFNLLVLLFCTTLVIATIRRIPLRFVNAGVWLIHTGIIMLCIGSYWYFATKVEGDAPVFRRKITINMPGMKSPEEMLVAPGNSITVTAGPDNWKFQIQDTNTDWPILSDEHKGKTAYAVNVMVQPPFGDPFIRQLLAGYPQYTEDVIPGKGRAIKNIGKKLVNEDLSLSLDYHATKEFQVMDSWALYVRKVGGKQWVERPIKGMPRYNDRIGSRDQVFSDPQFPIPLRPIDLSVPAVNQGDALADASIHITGYLRYARLERRWRAGDRLNPVLQASLVSTQLPPREYELLALDPEQNHTADGNIQFVWLPDRSELERLPKDSRAVLQIAVPSLNIDFRVSLTRDKFGGDFLPIGPGEFAYRIVSVHDNLALPNMAQPVSIVAVEFKTPEGQFRRWVASNPEFTKDMQGESADPHAMQTSPPDPRIVTTYQPQSAPVIFAAFPEGLHFVFNGPEGRLIGRDVKPGDSIEILEGLTMRIDDYESHAIPEVKPFVVPPTQQQAKVGNTFSMARIEVQTRKGTESQWVRFARYALPDVQYAMGGRFAYVPAVFDSAEGPVEVIFSRRRVQLPNPIAMEDFELDTHIGGFTGSAMTIRNYVSRLRFLDGDKWSEPVAIAVNNPTEFGGYWYFQSEWDKPDQSQPGGGMNFTGLGIGNRHGVYLQLAGCCVSVAGMIFAFYFKPMIKRNRATASRARIATGAGDAEPNFTMTKQEPLGVAAE